jgi:hypothetical protein
MRTVSMIAPAAVAAGFLIFGVTAWSEPADTTAQDAARAEAELAQRMRDMPVRCSTPVFGTEARRIGPATGEPEKDSVGFQQVGEQPCSPAAAPSTDLAARAPATPR